MTTFTLSPLQEKAAAFVKLWWESHHKPHIEGVTMSYVEKQPFFYLAGYAGTGKTSIAKALVEQLPPPRSFKPLTEDEQEREDRLAEMDDERPDPTKLQFAFAAFTGKASLVLSRKGCRPSSTVHRLIYKRVFDEKTKEFHFEKRDQLDRKLDLIILDECSMVNEEMGEDLLSFGVPILVLGDPGQLPPVEGAGFFTARNPDFLLTEIHRQAAASPILAAATKARQGIRLSAGLHEGNGSIVSVLTGQPPVSTMLAASQIICGLNRTRSAINDLMREHLGFSGPIPMVGEKLICLKNNWDLDGMMNGSLWRILEVKQLKDYRIELKLEDWEVFQPGTVTATTHNGFFDRDAPSIKGTDWKGLTQFTYGYAITCHKSQGSEWDDVLLYNEASSFKENSAKWLYTGITRAAKNLIIA